MNCPKCKERLVKEQYRQSDYLFCFYCEGIWLDKADIKEQNIVESFETLKENGVCSCPNCDLKQNLSVVRTQGFELELCKNCGGMFFDKGEIEAFCEKHRDMDTGALLSDSAEALHSFIKFMSNVQSVFRLFK